ncbi:MAG: S41 family peptidase [Maricaulaceae bacterium]
MKLLARLLIARAIAAALGLAALAVAAENNETSRRETFQKLELFGDVLSRIHADYVTETDDAELIDSAINGMLQALDPHSTYLDADAFRDMQVDTRGEYGGLGIEVVPDRGLVRVVAPIDETPASRAGVAAGDFITAIDGESIQGLGIDEAVDRMRGPVGAPITITIVREALEPFEVTLVRDTISPPVVVARAEGDIGYLRLSTFNEKAAESLIQAIDDLKLELGSSLRGFVLDLRNNPGGLLDQAVAVSDAFLDGGEVVSTRGRDPRDIQRYNARRGEEIDGLPIVVLINEGTASAAEIVAGAIQDRERGVLLGTTSFGKGSVQTVFPLRGGRDGALRLTIAKYYTPSGRSIQATGIQPDVAVAALRRPVDADGELLSRPTEADLPNALAAEEAAEPAGEGDTLDALAAANDNAPALVAEEPPEDWPEGEDYQLHRALEIIRSTGYTEQLAAASIRARSAR